MGRFSDLPGDPYGGISSYEGYNNSNFTSGGSLSFGSDENEQPIDKFSQRNKPKSAAAKNSTINKKPQKTAAQIAAERKEQQRVDNIARAKAQLERRNQNAPVSFVSVGNVNIPSTPMSMMNALSQKGRELMDKRLAKDGAEAIFDDKGQFAGVVTTGLFGGKVYSGRQIAGYEGDYKELIADTTRDEDDSGQTIVQDFQAGQKVSAAKKTSAGFNAVVPAMPEAPEVKGDLPKTEEVAKAKREYGQQTQVATSNQGLLTQARTRRRSLLAGGLLR